MAPLPANDVNTWIPPVPGNATSGVMGEAGFTPVSNAEATTLSWSLTTNAGLWAPGYNYGWNCQTYLNITGVNIAQTYSVEAPAEEKPQGGRKTKAGK